MSKSTKAAEVETIACDVCLKEIPKSESKSEEAKDYVRYFCGLECYEKWHALHDKHSSKEKNVS